PESTEAKLQLARVLYELRDPHAEDVLRSVLKLEPGNVEAIRRLAQVVARKGGEAHEILVLWERVAELQPNAVQPFVQRARVFERMHLSDRAEGEYRRAVDRDPRSAEALQNLARFYRISRRWEDALKAYQVFRDAHSGAFDALLGVATCLDRLDRFEEALNLY